MIGVPDNISFSRRLIVLYLLFSTGAVCVVSLAFVLAVHRVLCRNANSACLSQMRQAAAAIEIDHIRHRQQHIPELLARFRDDANLAYCAVLSPEGTYLAHTSEPLVGTTVAEPDGWYDPSSKPRSVSFQNQRAEAVREFRVPLTAGGRPIGTLQAATVEPDLWSTARIVGGEAAIALLLPLAVIGTGIWVLTRASRPLADVDRQLRRIAVDETGRPVAEPVAARSASLLGWNRLVDHVQALQHASAGESLKERLHQVLELRQRDEGQAVLNSLADGIAVTDERGTVRLANEAWAAMFGLACGAPDLTGRLLPDILETPAVAAGPSRLFDFSIRERGIVEEHPLGEGNSRRTLRIARHPLRTELTTGAGFVWCARDITQQKLVDKTREQFIDTATHELRTPLANIRAYAETLATCDELDGEAQREFYNTINTEATRLARFVDDLLSVSSMEVGSLLLDLQTVDTSRLFAEVVGKVRPLAEQKGVVVAVELPEKLPELALDKDKISATLVNLMGNGVKYTPAGGTVTLRVKVDEAALTIDVEDTGIGISEQELPQVFEKFFRSHDQRVREQSGTGLGLSLAQEIVRLHGGGIQVTSELNKGSTFRVVLPQAGK